MRKMRKSILALSLTTFALFSCTDDNEPEPVNEEELITTVSLVFAGDNGETKTFTFQDLDGTGPDTPTVSLDTLSPNTTYSVNVLFLNATENPAESITDEVREEGTDHQVFFGISPTLNISFMYNDADSEGKPIGLLTDFTTGAASSGKLAVILRHEPNKSAANVSDGDITNAGGETDIEVEFDVVIE